MDHLDNTLSVLVSMLAGREQIYLGVAGIPLGISESCSRRRQIRFGRRVSGWHGYQLLTASRRFNITMMGLFAIVTAYVVLFETDPSLSIWNILAYCMIAGTNVLLLCLHIASVRRNERMPPAVRDLHDYNQHKMPALLLAMAVGGFVFIPDSLMTIRGGLALLVLIYLAFSFTIALQAVLWSLRRGFGV